MLNKILLQGRIVNDIDVKTTPSGASVATFRIAVDRDFKSKDGQKETDFITIVAWRNTAEFVYKYFAKGRMILIDGRLQIRNYTDKDGNKRTSAEVVADSVYFSDSKKDDPLEGLANTVNNTFGNNFAEVKDDGDLPF